MSPRTKCGVVRVELPVCWKYGWLENAQRGAQNSVRIRHFRYRRRAAGVYYLETLIKPGYSLCSDVHLQGLTDIPGHSGPFAPTSGPGSGTFGAVECDVRPRSELLLC